MFLLSPTQIPNNNIRCVLYEYDTDNDLMHIMYILECETDESAIRYMLTLADLKPEDIMGILCNKDDFGAVPLNNGMYYTNSDVLTLGEVAELVRM